MAGDEAVEIPQELFDALGLARKDPALSRPTLGRLRLPNVTPISGSGAYRRSSFVEMPEARDRFDALPPSHRRGYAEWVAEAHDTAVRVDRARTTVTTLLDQAE